ncbi:MAG TPA: methyltransferase domain-containing protein [Nitrospirota bacterium]|nr:methyltransferase domain-containing protein [Nitrospirota bacterium]
MDGNRAHYIPALTFDWLTSLYDPLTRWIMPEKTFKRCLVEQARIKKGHRVLDLGCGTATLTILIKKAQSGAEVIGIDGDRRILEIAGSKVKSSGLDISLHEGMAFDLPCRDEYFDRVFSSLVFHHLTRDDKSRTLREIHRVLRPGGELHVADFGKPQNVLMYVISLIIRHFEEVSDNVQGLLPEMFRKAGFEQVEATAHYMTIFGTLSLYRARKTR